MRRLFRFACPSRTPLLFLLLLGAAASPARAQSLTIVNPRTGSFSVGQGTIEAAAVTVEPFGTYAEVGVYLTYGAKGVSATSADTLEVAHFFDLPADATVTDSWLWIDSTTIVRAKILDTWTATQIYENIVRRIRRDPSILYKRSATGYELRVYPIKTGERRRVKITYLVPVRTSAEGVTVPLPAGLLTVSRTPVTPVIVTWPKPDWTNPRLAELPGQPFRSVFDGVRGDHYEAALPASQRGTVSLVYRTDWALGPRLRVYRRGGDAWYALQTPLAPAPLGGRKVAVAVNLDRGALTATSYETVLTRLRTALAARLAATDSLLLFASRSSGLWRVTPRWVAADTASVRAAFSAIGPLAETSRLDGLLPEATRAAADAGAGLLVVNASNAEAPNAVSNAIFQALPARLSTTHVIDVTETNRFESFGGRTYTNDEYLFGLVAARSGGAYRRIMPGAFNSVFDAEVEAAMATFTPRLTSHEVMPVIPDGAAFTRTDLSTVSVLDRAYVQVGRFFGSDPTGVRVTGLRADGAPYVYTFPVRAEPGDSTLRALVAGIEARRLEAQPQTNDVVTRLVALSLAERVLSTRTAFLALEPSMGGEVCNTSACRDLGGRLTGTDDVTERGGNTLRTFPNPFRGQVSVSVTFARPVEGRTVRVEIYDMLGRRVRVLTVPEGLLATLHLTWDGTADGGTRAAPGTYLVVITTPQGRLTRAVTMLG